jgi:hypothetical protein
LYSAFAEISFRLATELLARPRKIGGDNRLPKRHVLEEFQRRRIPFGHGRRRVRHDQHVGLFEQCCHLMVRHQAREANAVANAQGVGERLEAVPVALGRMPADNQAACCRQQGQRTQQDIDALPWGAPEYATIGDADRGRNKSTTRRQPYAVGNHRQVIARSQSFRQIASKPLGNRHVAFRAPPHSRFASKQTPQFLAGGGRPP